MTADHLSDPGNTPGPDQVYVLGVMLAGSSKERALFEELSRRAIQLVRTRLDQLGLPIELEAFEGGERIAVTGTIDPLETLQLALAEKLERRLNFLLILSDAEATATRLSFAVAFPSRLTNIGLISLRRLMPSPDASAQSVEQAATRLGRLMLHSLGHLLNLGHRPDERAIMYDFGSLSDLDEMTDFEEDERRVLTENLPTEAHDETKRGSSLSFWARQIRANLSVIGGTLRRAHPIRLVSKLPTLLTTALSVVVVLFFSAEVWDVADAVEIYQIVVFVLLALTISSTVLYRTFGFRTILDRERLVSESTVVTQTATALAITATMLTVFGLFFAATYAAAVTIFPRQLMTAWTSVDPAVDAVDHIKLSLFLAGMAVLTGSLGGRSDSKRLIRTILFLDEET